MSGKSKLLACTSLIAVAMLAGPAFAGSKSPSAKAPTNVELLRRIEKLEADLQAQKDNQKSTKARVSTLEQNANDVSWSFDNSRPTIKSGDGRFSLSFRGRFQFDYADFSQRDHADVLNSKKTSPLTLAAKVPFDLSSGTLVRRAYIGVEGKAFKDFWYEFRLNFGGGNGSEGSDPQINIARIAYVGIPHFRLNVGVIEPVFAMGNNVSSGQLLFLERSETANIAASNYGAGDGRKGVELVFAKEGLLYGGDNLIVAASYTGTTTGKAAATSTTCTALPCTITANNFNAAAEGHGNGGDEQSQILAHIAYRLYSDSNSNFQVGGNYARVLNVNAVPGSFSLSERPEVRIDGTNLVSATVGANTDINSASLWGVEAQAQWKSFYVGGEYQKYDFDLYSKTNAPHFSSWYVEGSWVLTGESKGYEATAMNNEVGAFTMPKVTKPFSFSGHSWGAWELVARYSTLDLNFNVGNTGATANPITGGVQRGTTIGINWYLNQNIRLMLNDTMIQIEKSTVGAPTSTAPLNNFGGQNLNIIAARAQFQF